MAHEPRNWVEGLGARVCNTANLLRRNDSGTIVNVPYCMDAADADNLALVRVNEYPLLLYQFPLDELTERNAAEVAKDRNENIGKAAAVVDV